MKMKNWGVCATAYGQVQVAANAVYPPEGHPESHHFTWTQGRTLTEYQLLYLRQGQGFFESASTKARKVGTGALLLLFPGEWHRYRPDPATGWTESWIEFNGVYIEQLRLAGMIDPKNPVHRFQTTYEVEELMEKALNIVQAKAPAFTVQLGLLAVQILVLLSTASVRRKPMTRRMDSLISEAQAELRRNLETPVKAEQIARHLGIGYSYFRREFKRQTGLSPVQYRIEIRHRRTKDLLRNSSLPIKEISERLGYHSPYHLSSDFFQRAGVPPTRWRADMRRLT